MSITRIEQQRETILDNDAAQARRDAEAAVIARALDEAPYGHAELTAAQKAGRLGGLIAGLDRPTIRLCAIRGWVESGKAWGWGQVDATEAKLLALAAELDAAIVEASEEEAPTIEDLAELPIVEAYEAMSRDEPAPEPAALVSGPLAPTAAQLRATLDDWAQDATRDGERAAAAGDQAGVRWAAGRLKAIGRARDAIGAAAAAGRTLAVRLDDGATLVCGSAWYAVAGGRCSCPHGQRIADGRRVAGICWHRMLCDAIDAAADAAVSEADDAAALAA